MTRVRGFGRRAVVLVVAALCAAGAVGFPRGDARQATPPATPPVSSQILATGLPPAAPGETMYLYRVMVQPGARIVPHTHPGTQVASIAAGELTYTVLQGEVTITRAASEGTPGPTERATSGQEIVLRPGDALVEQAGMIHQARNDGSEPVVILISSLFPTGEPLSRPADPPATPVAAVQHSGGDAAAGVRAGAASAMPAATVEIRRRRSYHVSGQYGAAEGRGRLSRESCHWGRTSALVSTSMSCMALKR